MGEKVRIDKWLWAVRIFKTRSKATEACSKGRVMINDLPVKPSREIHAGEVVKVKMPPVIRSYRVLDSADKRMSAKLVPEFAEDITPPEELEILRINSSRWMHRKPGTGRPTKKERRDIDDFFNN
jgi:ribosome-associated heat shock protein Hsp15